MSPVGRTRVKWNVAYGARRVDQWTQLLRDDLKLSRVQMRDNGAESWWSLSLLGLACPGRTSPTTHHLAVCALSTLYFVRDGMD